MNRRSFIKAGLIFVPTIAKAQFHSVGFMASLGQGFSVPHYNPNAVDFDGTNDYMLRGGGLTGASNGKVGTVSFWVKFHDNVETAEAIFIGNYPGAGTAGEGISIYRFSGYRIYIDAYNSLGDKILSRNTDASLSVASGWNHIMASWDLSTLSVQLYVNGASSVNAGEQITVNDTIDYTQSQWCVGAGSDGTFKLNSCLSELYVNFSTQVDLPTNGYKFYNGGPVDLGADGSTPTGSPPIVFLNGNSSNFQTNAGTGGDFSVTGAITACSTSP